MDRDEARTVGTIGLVGGALLVLANLLHPFGSTELYSSGEAFVEHTSTFWIWLHFAIAGSLLVAPLVAHAWYRSLEGATARVWGRLGLFTITLGTAIGVLHLAGIDGAALASWREVLGSGSEDAAFGADVLMRVHLTTFVSWTFLMFGFGQLFLGVTELARPSGSRLLGALVVVGGLLGLGSSLLSGAGGQLTTLTDAGLLRPSAGLLTVWLFWESWVLRSRGTIVSRKGERAVTSA